MRNTQAVSSFLQRQKRTKRGFEVEMPPFDQAA